MTKRRNSVSGQEETSKANESPKAVPPKVEAGYYDAYATFARNLRQWLLAYGVGGPALLLSQEHLTDRISRSGDAETITALFAVGVGAQVGAALIYKSAMWRLYICELDCVDATSWQDKLAEWLSTAYWVECGFDLTSIACFAFGTWRAVVAANAIVQAVPNG